MSLIGYARVSTEDQATDAQVDALTTAGCAVIFREHMSGAKASRPELLKALAKAQRGDVLVLRARSRIFYPSSPNSTPKARISNRSPIPSTPRRHRGVSPCRCSAPSPN